MDISILLVAGSVAGTAAVLATLGWQARRTREQKTLAATAHAPPSIVPARSVPRSAARHSVVHIVPASPTLPRIMEEPVPVVAEGPKPDPERDEVERKLREIESWAALARAFHNALDLDLEWGTGVRRRRIRESPRVESRDALRTYLESMGKSPGPSGVESPSLRQSA